jgi:hypothetical protein
MLSWLQGTPCAAAALGDWQVHGESGLRANCLGPPS